MNTILLQKKKKNKISINFNHSICFKEKKDINMSEEISLKFYDYMANIGTLVFILSM